MKKRHKIDLCALLEKCQAQARMCYATYIDTWRITHLCPSFFIIYVVIPRVLGGRGMTTFFYLAAHPTIKATTTQLTSDNVV